jgi:signal transduction histidine kinase
MRFSFSKAKLPIRHKFLLSIVVIVTPILGILFTWMDLRSRDHILDQIVNQARVLSRQVVLTRQWVTDCGGVMVAAASIGAADTNFFYDDRMPTDRGLFHHFTPSMVTKKLSDYSLRENLYQFRLASLNPINPDNRPDDFESAALFHFTHENRDEFYHLNWEAEAPTFRYSVPLHMDDACLKCHDRQGFSTGTIGGALSFSFPADRFKTAIQTDRQRLMVAGVVVILLTTVTLLLVLRFVVTRPLRILEAVTDEISNGNLDVHVNLSTGDEFEHLGDAFNTMRSRLNRNRDIMEEKIGRATRELTQANTELQQLDRLKTDFFADMSHEMRSPITAIQGGVDYLKRTMKLPDNLNYLNIIDKNLLRLTHLVSDLLDLTRIEAGKVSWNFEEVDVAELIREVIEILSLKAEGRKVSLTYDNSEPIWAEIDMERIEQVLVNLIENAIKFSHKGGRVDLHTRVDAGTLYVSVTDRGIGIARESQERVFEKFHTLPSAGGSGQTKGTGLGLTICRKIVEAHGGTIWLESDTGLGSVFHFTLPLQHTVTRVADGTDSDCDDMR